MLGVLAIAACALWAAATRCMDDAVVGGVFAGIIVVALMPPLANVLLWGPMSPNGK